MTNLASPFNPSATLLFCPDQTDFLCFRSPEGFSAVDLNLVEGFCAGNVEDGTHTTIQLTNGSAYSSVESVPELVARYSAVKALRYRRERDEREIIHPLPTPTPAATPVERKASGVAIWTNSPPPPK